MSGDAEFAGTTFSSRMYFDKVVFDASSSFVNSKMKGETTFEGATFKTEPPKFFGAKLHPGTIWRGIRWPFVPKDKEEAGGFIDAYACLKLFLFGLGIRNKFRMK